MFTRQKATPVPEVGAEAPEFNLPSAQGGKLGLSMRTVRGPVIVAFYRPNNDDDVAYFKALAAKEDEINLAAGSVVGIGIAEPDEARALVRESGMKSYVLYDYVRVTSREWGLLHKTKELGEHSRPAVFVVGPDHKIVHAWTDERPEPAELLTKVSEISGLPKPAEEEKPQKAAESEEAANGETEAAPKKLSTEEREKIKAERRAAREAGKSLKTSSEGEGDANAEASTPKKLSAEEREKIKAERRAAREAGQSLKKPQDSANAGQSDTGAEAADESGAPKKLTAEDRERIKAERRAAREAGQSLKTPQEPAASGEESAAPAEGGAESAAPKKLTAEDRERIKAERRAAREAGKSVKTPSAGAKPDAPSPKTDGASEEGE